MTVGSRTQRVLIGILAAITLRPASAAPADEILAALYPCTTAFFNVLESNNAAFATATLKDFGTPPENGKVGKDPSFAGTVVSFATPVAAQGLTIAAYVQMQRSSKGKPEQFLWGVRVLEAPDLIVAQIKATLKEADFQQRGLAYGWVQELAPDWRRTDATLIETRLPQRMLLVEPSGNPATPGSTIRCAVHVSKMGAMTALPPVTKLFPNAR